MSLVWSRVAGWTCALALLHLKLALAILLLHAVAGQPAWERPMEVALPDCSRPQNSFFTVGIVGWSFIWHPASLTTHPSLLLKGKARFGREIEKSNEWRSNLYHPLPWSRHFGRVFFCLGLRAGIGRKTRENASRIQYHPFKSGALTVFVQAISPKPLQAAVSALLRSWPYGASSSWTGLLRSTNASMIL